MDNNTTFDIQTFLPYRINILAKRISQDLSAIYTREFDITIPQWRTLLWLNSNENVHAKDICYYCLMDKTQVSRVVSSLEERDLIERKTDAKDHRSQQITLTLSGKQLIAEIVPKAQAWEQSLIETLSNNEYQDLFAMIEKLETQLDKGDTSE